MPGSQKVCAQHFHSCLRVATPNHPLPQPVPSRDPTDTNPFNKTLGEDSSPSKCYTAAEVEGAAAQTDRGIRPKTLQPTVIPIASHNRDTHHLLKHSDYDKVNFWKNTTFGVTVPDYRDTWKKQHIVNSLEIIDTRRSDDNVCDLRLCLFVLYNEDIEFTF